ncbi:MAG: agmatinase [Syntrophaceticus sp.]
MRAGDLCVRDWSFLAAKNSYQEALLVLAGIPLDLTSSFRPGSRQGPQAIRSVSEGLEEYSPYLKMELTDCSFYDEGDLLLPYGNLQICFNRIEHLCRLLLQDEKLPFLMGGEHLISFPIVKAVLDFYPDLAVLHFDAHADLRDDYLGETYSHATVIRRVCELVGPENVYQFGIRSGTKEEFAYGSRFTHFYPFEILHGLESSLPKLKGRPLYVTIDIDVVDPSYAPGTGTPEPGGVSPQELFRVLDLLQGWNVVGADIVELAPVYDPSGITTLMAAKLVREGLLAFSKGRMTECD